MIECSAHIAPFFLVRHTLAQVSPSGLSCPQLGLVSSKGKRPSHKNGRRTNNNWETFQRCRKDSGT